MPLLSNMLVFVLGLVLTVSAVAAELQSEQAPAESAQQQPPPQVELQAMPATPAEGSGAVVLSSNDYRIGPSDQLEIDVFQIAELSGVERVNSRGYIKMPLIGSVQVSGLTQEEAEYLIAELYAVDYLEDPQVNIDIVDYASQQVTVMGAVERPGVFPLKGKTTLLQALAFAGGTARLAHEEGVVVFRANKEGVVVGYVVDLEQIQEGLKGDPEVIGSDKIVVPESGSASALKGITDTLRGFVGFERY
jgi:polysaccharide export outer membrane protein